MEYATQDSDPRKFEPFRAPIEARAAAFRQQLIETEPEQLQAVVRWAAAAFRRPLSVEEGDALLRFYRGLRDEQLPHDEAIRLTIARILVAPAFLYRIETAAPGIEPGPVSSSELASRMSYFLWSSLPDRPLRDAALTDQLQDPAIRVDQARRMLRDDRIRRLAAEFACQWLQIYDFASLDEKSEQHFPSFIAMREAMYEESIRFFTDFFQNDRSVLEVLSADATFLNDDLAAHYGIPDVLGGQWRRVEGLRRHGRGGVLGMASILTKQSGASRTSPVLRGNWLNEVILGEPLPRPPKDVPRLPEDEVSTDGLTVRQRVEKHRSIPQCAVCHERIDPFGFALEAFDAIGRRRETDLGGQRIDAGAVLHDGSQFTGLSGLRDYLLTRRREQFVRHFCRKLLGYALGRSVQLSDEPLLDQMVSRLENNDYHVGIAIEEIVVSPQFSRIRGRDADSSEQEDDR
jgi:hypothetical protein